MTPHRSARIAPCECVFISALLAALIVSTAAPAATLTGEIRDEATGQLVAARVYIQSSQGQWFFAARPTQPARRLSTGSSAATRAPKCTRPCRRIRLRPNCPPGKYTLTVERGKEYLTVEQTVEVGERPVKVEIKLQRWINMAEQGWYSGDTHVHRTLDELPTAMLADDLNVALPLTYWVTKSDTPPQPGRQESAAGRAEADRGDAAARHLAAQHRVRDLHRRRQAAHARRGVRPGHHKGRSPAACRRCGRSPSRCTRRRAARSRQAQLALVDDAGAGDEGRSVRAGQQPPLADRVRLPRWGEPIPRLHEPADATRPAWTRRPGPSSAFRTTTPCSTAAFA